jgi:hypothetical protein
MNDNVIELIAALDKLSSATNEFEAQAAVNRLKHALSDETTESDREEAQFRLRDKVRESVLSDALADYDEHSELYPERVLTLHNTLPVVMGKIPRAEFKEDVLCAKDILPRFGELAQCKTGDEIRAFVDNLSARFEQHPEYREAGYRRLLWELEDEIICAYAEVFFRVADRSWRAGYQMSLLAALEESIVCAYPPNFLFFEDATFQVISPQNLLAETDLTALRKKLDLLRSALSCWDAASCSGYLENLLYQISKAILDALRASPEWEESSAATKLRANYLSKIFPDGLCGLTETVEEVEDAPPEDNFMNAQMELHKLCAETDAEYLENDWADFLIFSAASPDVDALSMQAVLSLTVAVLAMEAPDDLPETLQCLIRFFLTASAWPMSFTYNDTVLRWILSGDDAA